MRFIIAKFKSKCQETGQTINKGDKILYNPVLKMVYCENSKAYKDEQEFDRSFIPDPGEQFFENWCQHNGI